MITNGACIFVYKRIAHLRSQKKRIFMSKNEARNYDHKWGAHLCSQTEHVIMIANEARTCDNKRSVTL